MKKLLVVCLMTIGLNTPALAVAHPKLDALVLTPQTEFTIPQFCDKFGWMLTDIVKLALKNGKKYTVEIGKDYVNSAFKIISSNSGLEIRNDWKMFTLGVLPTVPLASTFKDRFFQVKQITENENFQIYNLGFDTCLESLEIMQAEENSLNSLQSN